MIIKSSISKYLNQITHGDSLILLKELPSNSVDLIFADPPYNLQLKNDLYRPNQTKVNGVSENWDKFTSFEEYDRFLLSWLTECQRILKKSGSIWISGTYHNIYRIGYHMQNLGYHILNDVIWVKSNPTPNFRGVRMTNAHETLLWAIKNSKSTYTFNHQLLKKYNKGKQLRSDWFVRTNSKLLPEIFQTSLSSPSERIKNSKGEKLHSVQKPVALLERIILGTTNKGDVVLDPFGGTGTTAYVCVKHRRNYICFEKEGAYINPSQDRVSALKLTRKAVNTKFLSDPEFFIHIKSTNKKFEKPFAQHKMHLDKLIERYLTLQHIYGKSVDITKVVLPKKEWEILMWKSNPDNIKMIIELVKIKSTLKDKFRKKRALLSDVKNEFPENAATGELTETKFRKVMKNYGFRITRSDDQYYIYPKVHNT